MHGTASQGFGAAAVAYESGRPDYPREATTWLISELGLGPGRSVLDMAAGTGKLSRAIVPCGVAVLAVEPVAAMRSVLSLSFPTARILDGTAEAIPLGAATVDAVVVAQAFHWFDGPAALDEFHRVLRPRGRLALIWNSRNREQPLQRAVAEIVNPWRGDTPTHGNGAWRGAFEKTGAFTLAAERHVPFEQPLQATQLLNQVASISFIAALDENRRLEVLAEVRALTATVPAPLALSYVTDVFVYERT